MVLDEVVSISHFVPRTSDSDKERYVVDEGMQAIPMNIQPATPEEVAIADGIFGQTFTAFTSYSGVHAGDLVTVSGTGRKFRVKGVEDWSSPDLAPHHVCTLVEFEEEEL